MQPVSHANFLSERNKCHLMKGIKICKLNTFCSNVPV